LSDNQEPDRLSKLFEYLTRTMPPNDERSNQVFSSMASAIAILNANQWDLNESLKDADRDNFTTVNPEYNVEVFSQMLPSLHNKDILQYNLAIADPRFEKPEGMD
jgi:hypothetical protein